MKYHGFDIREYVPKSVSDEWGDASIRFLDDRLVRADYELKRMLEGFYKEEISVTINDWCFGGKLDDRGFRPPTSTVGKWTSSHRQGRGSDKSFKFKKSGKTIPIKDVFDFIIKNESYFYSIGVRRIEDVAFTPTWLHWDVTWTTLPFGKIQIVKP